MFAVLAVALAACGSGIRNFTRIEAAAGIGGATPPSSMAWLKEQGYVAVINLRLADEEGVDVEGCRAAARAVGIRYIHLPFDSEQPDPQLVDRFMAAAGDPSNQPVYFYCNSANRAGSLWMIKRVLQDGWTIDRARAEATRVGLTEEAGEKFAVGYIRAHR